MHRFLSLLLWCSIGISWAEPPLQQWQARPEEKQALALATQQRWQHLFTPQGLRPRSTSIDLAGLVLDGLATDQPGAQLDQTLAALAALQDTQPSSRTFGNWFWYAGDTHIVDRNAVEFVTRKLALAWQLYQSRLTPAQQQRLLEMLHLAQTGIQQHAVRVSYTNIYLMKTWNLIALGEGLKDSSMADKGYTQLRQWLENTAQTGINEYLSPSYYDIDLECLGLIANLSHNANARQQARLGLEFFWHDITLNWFLPANRLGSVHSRDYNRLYSVGGLNRKTAWAWSGAQTASAPNHTPFDALSWVAPSPQALAWLSGPYPRLVVERWGREPEKQLVHYLGQHVSLGTADSGYSSGHDNTPMVINLGAGQDSPIINFFMDDRQDYYGQHKTLEAGSGHMKALHLRPFLSSVQQNNTALFLASQANTSPDTSLESVITLPADAEYWLDEQKLALFTQRSAWKADPQPNDSSTQIQVRNRDGHPEVQLIDHDAQLGLGLSQTFPVVPGQHYRLRATLAEGEIALYLNFLDQQGHLIGVEHLQRVGPGKQSFSAEAPPQAVWCKAWIYSSIASQSTVRLTDLAFEAQPPQQLAQEIAGFDFQAFVPNQITIPVGATLTIRRGDAAAALRLLGAWDVDGHSVPFILHNDGLAYRALRLTATHAQSGQQGRGSIVVWAQVAEGLDQEKDFMAFRQQAAARTWAARLEGPILAAQAGPLQLKADVVHGVRLERHGGPSLPDATVIWVNGQDLGAKLLSTAPQP